MNNATADQLFISEGSLGSFVWHCGERLATLEEVQDCPRDVGSIWEALRPGEFLELADGVYAVDKDGDLVAA